MSVTLLFHNLKSLSIIRWGQWGVYPNHTQTVFPHNKLLVSAFESVFLLESKVKTSAVRRNDVGSVEVKSDIQSTIARRRKTGADLPKFDLLLYGATAGQQ